MPGQVYYNSTRQLVLRAPTASSSSPTRQDDALDANLESCRTWRTTSSEYGSISTRSRSCIQYNKRDLPNVIPVEYLEYMLNRKTRRVPYFESVAVEGKGVFDTLNTVSRMVLVAGFGQEQGALNESK